MNWWGKLIGSGVGLLIGPVGALAGAAIGHLYDEDDPTPANERKARILYFAYFFSCAAKISKADGNISEKEIEATELLMNRFGLEGKMKEFAKNVFRKSRGSKRSIDDDFKEVGSLIGFDSTVAQSFLGGLYEIVRSNGKNHNEIQVRFLLRGEERLKLQPGTVKHWIRGGYAPPNQDPNNNELTLNEAYQVLSLRNDCRDSEIKNSYRLRVADFHPDKLRSKNLPEEFIAFANNQLARINEAQDIIQKARGLK